MWNRTPGLVIGVQWTGVTGPPCVVRGVPRTAVKARPLRPRQGLVGLPGLRVVQEVRGFGGPLPLPARAWGRREGNSKVVGPRSASGSRGHPPMRGRSVPGSACTYPGAHFSPRPPRCTPTPCTRLEARWVADLQVHTLKRNENRCSRPLSAVVGDSRKMSSDLRLCGDPAVGSRWRRTVSAGLLADCLRTAGQVERPLVRAASNSVRATCPAFSVAAAPTGFAS